MNTTKKETLQLETDRSATLRANIKRYYIYVDQPAAQRCADPDVERLIYAPHDLGLH